MPENKLNSFEALKNLKFENLNESDEIEASGIEFKKQSLEAHFSNKARGGKTVTIIKGFDLNSNEIKIILKTLQKAVGVGGSMKNNEIIIQGNYRKQIMTLLQGMGHDVKRIGG
jgi:translation initiation factor 1